MSEEKKGFFARLKEGLTKTRDNIVRGIDSVFSGFSAIDDDFYEELEDGIRNIVVIRLDRDFTVADYENGLPFSIDHYAPGTASFSKALRGLSVVFSKR